MCLGQKQLCGSPGTHPAWRQVHSKDLHSHLSMSAPVLSALSCLSSAGCPHCTFIIPRPFLSAALLFRQSFRINKCSFQTIYFLCLTQVLDYDAKVALNLWFSCLSFEWLWLLTDLSHQARFYCLLLTNSSLPPQLFASVCIHFWETASSDIILSWQPPGGVWQIRSIMLQLVWLLMSAAMANLSDAGQGSFSRIACKILPLWFPSVPLCVICLAFVELLGSVSLWFCLYFEMFSAVSSLFFFLVL